MHTTMDIGLMEKRQSCVTPNTNTITKSTSTLSPSMILHRDAKMISKPRPKIRIIHIFAPEIIKTDVANFRELVQRLTGKPTSQNKSNRKQQQQQQQQRVVNRPAKKLEIRTGFRPGELRERTKGEEEIWGGANSGGGFLGGFADLDGFMQELNAFPVLPLDSDAFGDHHSQLA